MYDFGDEYDSIMDRLYTGAEDAQAALDAQAERTAYAMPPTPPAAMKTLKIELTTRTLEVRADERTIAAIIADWLGGIPRIEADVEVRSSLVKSEWRQQHMWLNAAHIVSIIG